MSCNVISGHIEYFQIIIMKKLIPVANKLFEKWADGIDRDTQQATWNDVATECQAEGLSVGDGMALKNCVRNWINRAEVYHLKKFVVNIFQNFENFLSRNSRAI